MMAANPAIPQAVPARPGLSFFAMTLAVALILMAPSIANGSPFIFFDSEQFFRIGERIFNTVFGLGGGGDAAGQAAGAAPGMAPAAPSTGGGIAVVAGGRGPIYSVFLYATSTFLGMWTTAALQALACAVLIVRFCQLAWGRLSWTPVLAVAAALSLLCGLGFHAAFMMPDVFAGCLVLVLAIFLYFKPASRIENVLLVGGAFVMATMHTTNLLLVVSALIAAVIVLAVERKPIRAALPRLGAIAGVAVATVAFNTLFATAVHAISGDDLRSPPYLMARLIADGPGEVYLAKHCTAPDKPFAACAFANIDFRDQEQFLWAPSAGGFQSSDAELRTALGAEELRFVAAVIAAEPAAQFAASFGNFSRQLVSTGIGEIIAGVPAFAAQPNWRDAEILKVTPSAGCMRDNTCAPPVFATTWYYVIMVANWLFMLAFAVLALWFATLGRSSLSALPETATPLIRSACFLALLVLANAAICGVLSGVNDRYQTRMVWSLALAMMAFAPVAFRALRLDGWRAPGASAISG